MPTVSPLHWAHTPGRAGSNPRPAHPYRRMFHLTLQSDGTAHLVETATGRQVATGRMVADLAVRPDTATKIIVPLRFVGEPLKEAA